MMIRVVWCMTILSMGGLGMDALFSAEEISGFSEPLRSIDLSVAEAGVVALIEVREGDKVTAGQKLGSLDVAVLESALRIAELRAASETEIASAAARLQLAKSRMGKIEKLAAGNSAGSDEVERARIDLVVAESEQAKAVENQKAALLDVEQTRSQIERGTFRSPLNGVVDRVFADVGESLDARTSPIMKIVQTDSLNIIFHVSPAIASALESGKIVRVRALEATELSEARVEYISPVVDPASGTIRVKVQLNNPDGKHRSGVRFLLDLTETKS